MSICLFLTSRLTVAVAAVFWGLSLIACEPVAAADDACADLPPAQQAVAKTWKQSSVQAVAGRTAADAALLTLGQRTRISLSPARDIPSLRTSHPREQGTAGYAGLLRFRVQTAGLYVVGSASKVWIEVIPDAAGDPLLTEDIDRSLRCTGIHKALSYRLDADRIYVLQISQSAEAHVELLLQALFAATARPK